MESYRGLFFFTRSIGGRSNDLYNETNYFKSKVMRMKTS